MTLRPFTRIRARLAVLAVALAAIGGAGGAFAYAAAAAGPPVTSPSSGPVHMCASTTNESVAYTELHSTALGNCAAGYRQLTLNELTPAFTLELGGTAYDCTAATAQDETALTCTQPASATPSPTPTPSSSVSSST
jgi:hypothetical protein